MNEYLTVAEVAKMLNLSYGTVYSHRQEWGFFQMSGSRVWTVAKDELEKNRKKRHNLIRLAPIQLEKNKCQSREEALFGGLISLPHLEKELGDLQERKTSGKHKSIMTN